MASEETIFQRTRREARAARLAEAARNGAWLVLMRKFQREGVTVAEAGREAAALIARDPDGEEVAAAIAEGMAEEEERAARARGSAIAGPHDLPRLEHGPGPRHYADRRSRRRLVARLRAKHHLSLRAIAGIVGTSLGTVQRDIDWLQAHWDEADWIDDEWDEEGDTSIKGIASLGRNGILYPPRPPKPPKRDRS